MQSNATPIAVVGGGDGVGRLISEPVMLGDI